MHVWVLRSMHERVSFNVYGHLGNILEMLSNYGVAGTFFVAGEIAEKHPSILQRICKGDHEIASHGYTHASFSDASYAQAEDQLAKSIKILGKFQEIKGFRAPFLSRNKATYLACEKLGLSYDSSEYGLKKYCPPGFKVTVLPVVSPSDTQGLDIMNLRSKDLVARWISNFSKSSAATVCMHVGRIGRKRYVKTILEPLLKSNASFVSAWNLVHRNGVALTFDVEYASFSASLSEHVLRKSTRKQRESLLAQEFLKSAS